MAVKKASDNIYNSSGFLKSDNEIKQQMVTQQGELIKNKGGIVGRLLGNDRDIIPFNAGFLLTIVFSIVSIVIAFLKPDLLNVFIPIVTLSLGYTFGSKTPK